MSSFLDNFIGGMAFGMLVNNPFARGCFGFGIYPVMYGSMNFGGFANPFPSVFGPGYNMSSSAAMIPPTTFANPSFPTVDCNGVCQTIWDTYTNPDSEYNKRMREAYQEYEKQMKESNKSNQQYPFMSFFNLPQISFNPFSYWFGPQQSSDKSTDKKDKPVQQSTGFNRYDDKRFNKFLSILMDREGGYSNNKNDRGGETLKGVTHTTYDEYRKSKGLPTQSVTKMTDDEMQEIYYEKFYKASGADKISDKKLALYVFDTAVNMGVSVAKDFLDKCGGDRSKFEQLRKNRYKAIIEKDSRQKVHEDGWNNRVIAIKDAADNQLNTIA